MMNCQTSTAQFFVPALVFAFGSSLTQREGEDE